MEKDTSTNKPDNMPTQDKLSLEAFRALFERTRNEAQPVLDYLRDK